MSQPVNQTVKCPQCGADIPFTLWRSINTDVPNAIDDIISGKLFAVECEKCGHARPNWCLKVQSVQSVPWT